MLPLHCFWTKTPYFTKPNITLNTSLQGFRRHISGIEIRLKKQNTINLLGNEKDGR